MLLVVMHNPLDFRSILLPAIPLYGSMGLPLFGGSKEGKGQESVFPIP